MATRVLQFQAQIPAGTPVAAPVTIPLALDNWVVERIDLDVPAGPAGLMGFQIYNNGVPWIPYGAGQYIIWDDTKDSYYLTEQPTGSGWAVVGYNLDAFYPHTVTVRFHVSPPEQNTAANSPALPTFITTAAPNSEVVTL